MERIMSTASESTSTIAAYAFAIASTLEQQGVPPETVFERCDITLPATTDPMLRFTQTQINQLFEEAIKATADPCFGLAVAEALHPGNLHAVGYALLASTTLRDFSERLRKYYRLAAQVIDIDLAERDGEFLLVTRVAIDDICWETQDAYAALMVRFMRFIYKPDFSPLRLTLIRPEPVACRPQFDDYFHCEISFDNPDLVIVKHLAISLRCPIVEAFIIVTLVPPHKVSLSKLAYNLDDLVFRRDNHHGRTHCQLLPHHDHRIDDPGLRQFRRQDPRWSSTLTHGQGRLCLRQQTRGHLLCNRFRRYG
jgi:hypothetical protein